MIPIFKPFFGEEELEAVREVFESSWLGLGPRVAEFEQRFADFLGVPHAIAVNSGTAALHLALRVALKVAYIERSEVITTPMTFVSTNHAILYSWGVPVFADIEPDTLNIDPIDIERKITPKTRAIMVVHYGGHACDMEKILSLADRHNLFVIEDCAHACGGLWKNRKLGTLGDFGCFSFHAVKNLATGDGGMITTKDARVAERLRRLRWLGIDRGTWERNDAPQYSWAYDVKELGFKCHMNDITAAIGLAQLDKLQCMNDRRWCLAWRYTGALKDIPWLETPVRRDYAHSAWHNYVIKVVDPADRDPLIEHLYRRGISAGVHYYPNHLYEMYKGNHQCPVAEEVWRRLITLPLYPDLTWPQQDRIVYAIKEFKL